ncbi:general transcription factor II-I repeat domain-containing protein 2A-like [Clavelina lepadiformis]|uniref:general transcription factor II-I repeat domain-containing protein 2A-like n=1 Tax=Clavelina lepadiformis TaxID=159417 RepID=UPI00404333B4
MSILQRSTPGEFRMLAKRRKVDDECRGFNEEWTEKYFSILHFGKPTCLICNQSVSQNTESEKNTLASYEVAKVIAKNMKPFTDGDYVKDCLMAVVKVICPEKKKLFSDVSLSARTVTRRIEEMSQDVKTRQQDCLKNLQYFSIAIDESTDTTDTAQLAVFVRGVSSNFDIFEDFVELVPMKGTATGADILKALLQCTNSLNLDLSKLVSVTTDGAPAMIGKNKGAVALLQKHLEDLGRNDKISKVHCLIHQEALCAKTTNLKSVMDTVVKAVNMILSHKRNHRQFRQMLPEAENQYGDALYFCEVRWLSRGAMLARVYELRNEIATFLENTSINATEFRNPEWVSNLAFLVDLTSHLNKLNLQLQGKKQLIHEMWRHILAFETKLRLWECQLDKENYVHFPILEESKPSYSPFDVDANTIPEKFQMDLIEMQCSDEFKAKFHTKGISLLDFYKKIRCWPSATCTQYHCTADSPLEKNPSTLNLTSSQCIGYLLNSGRDSRFYTLLLKL